MNDRITTGSDEDLEAPAPESVEQDPYGNMSDEEFEKLTAPVEPELEEEEEVEHAPAEHEADGDQPADEVVEAGAGWDQEEEEVLEKAPAAAPSVSKDKPATQPEPSKAPEGESAQKPADGRTDYEALYKKLMSPFKANGREFKPESPEELVRLAQMGANYTKKMQTLQPNLRLMKMLDNNDLLDESKLAFLIDLAQKKPEAVQKLLHDSKIDPLDFDMSQEPAYTPGNYAVSDQEMVFNEVLANVMETSTGKDTVSHINSEWDKTSKEAIYRDPQLLAVINDQRVTGIYDQISAEVHRSQVLGNIPPNMPFIEAYKTIGDRLHSAGQLRPNGPQGVVTAAPQAPAQPARPQVVDTRPAYRKPSVQNSDKARAVASPPRSGKAASSPPLDIFSMSDAEIMTLNTLKV